MANFRRIDLGSIAALAFMWNTASGQQYLGRVIDKTTGAGKDSVSGISYSPGNTKKLMTDSNGFYILDLTTAVNDDTGVKQTGEIRFSNIENRVKVQTPQAKNTKISIDNILGQEIANYKTENSSQIEFSTNDLRTGVYPAIIEVDGQRRNTLLSVVNGKLQGYKLMKPFDIIKNIAQGAQGKLSKTGAAIIDSIKFTGRNIMDLVKKNPTITGNTIETVLATPAVNINVTSYGATADSGIGLILLPGSKVWIGTRYINDPNNYMSVTGFDGKATLKVPKIASIDTLFIEANGYWQRNILIDRLATTVKGQNHSPTRAKTFPPCRAIIIPPPGP